MNYIKQNIKDLLPKKPIDLVKGLTEGLDKYLEYYSIIQYSNIKNILDNFETSYFFTVRGAAGCGKSSFKSVIRNALDINAKVFEFNCNEVTDLDDIFFALYKFIQKNPLKKDIFRKETSTFKPSSIDDQIIHYLKETNNNLVLIFENFEKLIMDNGELRSENMKSFFEFLSINNNFKVILFSQVNIEVVLDLDNIEVFETRLTGLEEEQLKDFFAIFKIDVPQSLNSEIFDKTSGYLYSLKFLATASKILNTSVATLLKEASLQPVNFNIFLAKKFMQKLPQSAKKTLFYFSVFRHEINENILKTIDHFDNVSADIELLKAHMLIDGENNYEIKDFLRDYIYESLTPKEKMALHEKVANFYADQIPMKPSERVIELSRTSMYSEKFYHFNLYSKLSKKQELQSSRSENAIKINNRLKSDDIKYIASTKYLPNFDLSKPDEQTTDTTESTQETTETKNENKFNTDDIELTEEEKELLGDSNNYYDTDEEDNNNENTNKKNIDPNEFFATQLYTDNTDNDITSSEGYGYSDNYYQTTINTDFGENLDEIKEAAANDEVNRAEEILKTGIEHFQNGNLNESISYLKNAVSLLQNKDDKNFCLAKLSLVRALADNYKFDEAQEHLKDLQKYDLPIEAKADILIEKASIEESKNNFDAAEETYNQVLDLIKDNILPNHCAKVNFKLALMYDDKNDIDKALGYYFLTISDATNDTDEFLLASAYSNIASIYEEKNDFNKAVEYYKKSLKIDENSENFEGQAKTLSALGNILFTQNQINLAIRTFIQETSAAKKTQDNYYIASSYLELGDVFLKTKDYKNAIKAYTLAKKHIDNTISTDSKNKIERRFDMIVDEIGENAYRFLLQELRK